MEENFEPVARTRANYYTPGSPVQFVCVELLKGEISGEHAVCLTFKNISKVTLTALEIHFKCKGVDGIILCEDEFEYRDIAVKPGESFGMDDAVFVTQKAITSVDVSLKNVYNGKRVVHLDAIKRVRLPAPRILLQNALNTLLQPEQPDPVPAAQPEAPVRPVQPAAQEEPTRIMSSAAQEEATRVMPARPHVEQAASFAPPLEPVEAGEQTRILDARNYQPAARAARPDDEGTRVMPAAVRDAAPAPQRAPEPQPVDEEDYEEEADSRDSIAETLIRWVPPITAIICAGIALWGFVYYQFIL